MQIPVEEPVHAESDVEVRLRLQHYAPAGDDLLGPRYQDADGRRQTVDVPQAVGAHVTSPSCMNRNHNARLHRNSQRADGNIQNNWTALAGAAVRVSLHSPL